MQIVAMIRQIQLIFRLFCWYWSGFSVKLRLVNCLGLIL